VEGGGGGVELADERDEVGEASATEGLKKLGSVARVERILDVQQKNGPVGMGLPECLEAANYELYPCRRPRPRY